MQHGDFSTFYALNATNKFGYSAVALGDVNGDGVGDLAVGAHGDNEDGTQAGAVFVLFLNTDGNVKHAQKISNLHGVSAFYTLEAGSGFGVFVAALGDVNGDGVRDLAAGAFADNDGGAGVGAVYVLLLATNGLVVQAQKVSMLRGGLNAFYTLDDNDSFAFSLAALDDFDGDSVGDLAVGAYSDGDGGSSAGAVYVLTLETDGNLKGAHKISMLYGDLSAFYTLEEADLFGISVASLGDFDGNGVTDVAVGAFLDDDNGSDVGAVYVLFLQTDVNVIGAQKLSNLYGNINSFHSLASSDSFGMSISALGDLDGDGVGDLAIGARKDDDGGADAGAVYMVFLEIDATVKRTRKVSMLYGNFNALYTLASSDGFGISVSALGDLNGDGVVDMAVGAFADDDGAVDAGAIYVLNLQDSYCETPSPTVLPPGFCFSSTSTAVRLSSNGKGSEQVPLAELARGDWILSLDQDNKPTFAEIMSLPRGPAAEPFIHIVMAGKVKHELKATLHHTFDTCDSSHNSIKHGVEVFGANIVQAKDLKAGDCLHTTDGKRTVHSVKHMAHKADDIAYSIQLSDNAHTVAIGGVFTHAIGYTSLPGQHAQSHGKDKKTTLRESQFNYGHAYLRHLPHR